MAFAALVTLVCALPFEREIAPVPGGFSLTTLEVITAIALGTGLLAIARADTAIVWPAPAGPAVIFLALMALAAIAAPAHEGNSLRFVARLSTAALVAFVTTQLAAAVGQVRTLVRALVLVAAAVALVAVLEALQVGTVMRALTVFRPGFHVVAGQLRATGTLFYPTIASMFFEVAFALGLWLLVEPRDSRERLLALTALTAIGAGIAATFTRAGLLGMAAAVALMTIVVVRGRTERRLRLAALALLAAGVAAATLLLHSPALLATRLRTEGSQGWYGVRYDVPPRIDLTTGSTTTVDVALTNTGRLTWDSNREPPFALAYHWLRRDSGTVVQFEGQRTPFAHAVAPGERVRLAAYVTAPSQPGSYTLVWDVVHETRAWLSTEGIAPATTAARVEGAATAALATTLPRLPPAVIRPDRRQLWRAALAMTADHPWLGVGPDNFRLTYGRYAGLDRADPRVHANNVYLEVLTGAGLPGLAAWLWLVAAVLWPLAVRLRRDTAPIATAALLGACVLTAVHGLVDAFLAFTTTYLAFAMACGLAFARAWTPAAEGRG